MLELLQRFTRRSTPKALFYYGTELPDIHAVRALRDTIVVLQPYHPLLSEGLFASWFPRCRRYLYWSPVLLPDGLAIEPTLKLKSSGERLRLLDLDDAETAAHVLREGLKLARNKEIHGLFVDGLDSYAETEQGRQQVGTLIEAILRDQPSLNFFINRAFAIWPRISRLEAVLLEDFYPDGLWRYSESELRWAERQIELHLHTLRVVQPDVKIIALQYDDGVSQEPMELAEQSASQRVILAVDRLRNMITFEIRGNRLMNTWPNFRKCSAVRHG